ncbi:transketolase family protein [Paraburkholderia xenovorans]|uniref:transketolase family protein n=1 Tax=Paraburkholderia xenovorans TaxID=36873 RepID=UPI0015C55D78|nr:transketolase C-terminal domain-containing protein [Paraburkholderia xenovorans]NPT38503.1 transketolase [Paraburkholderia xenovorans]
MNAPQDPKSWNIETSLPRLTSFTMGDELASIAATRDDIVVLTADLMYSNGTKAFFDRYPQRFYNVGIAEQNMISMAAGMAASGLTPYVSTFASFASLLGAEQIRTDLAYPSMPVRILAHHAGIAMGFYGTSHHAVEDLAVMRAMANMTVVSPCDGAAVRGILRATVNVRGPVYIRLGRGVEPVVYDTVPKFEEGRFFRLREGTDATLIATGLGVRASLDAALALESEGLSVAVLDAVYVKPIDIDGVIDAANRTGAIMTVEEHNPNGGLGGAVAEVLAEAGIRAVFKRHALPDDYALVAPPTHLYRHYGLTAEGIAERLKALLRT